MLFLPQTTIVAAFGLATASVFVLYSKRNFTKLLIRAKQIEDRLFTIISLGFGIPCFLAIIAVQVSKLLFDSNIFIYNRVYYIVISIVLFVTITFGMFSASLINKTLNNFLPAALMILLYAVLFALASSQLILAKELKESKKGIRVTNVQFKYKETLIKTDSVLIFIGGTKEYLFLYHRKSQNSVVLKREEIDSLVIKGAYHYSGGILFPSFRY
jgi:hypothetical protein